MTRNAILWLVWLAGTLVAGAAVAAIMYVGGSREALLIGQTTGAHHQIELSCESCHAADAFATPKKTAKAMNKACLSCHKDELKLSNDSHPVKKFRDPRNADVRAKLDALYCHTCHAEHKPEITRVSAVSLPMDYCSACHEEVYKNRPSHEGYGFETCATAGCHNFHDNTALYEEFLVKHAGGPDIAELAILTGAAVSRSERPVVLALAEADPKAALTTYLTGLEEAPEDPAAAAEEMLVQVLTAADAVAPAAYLTEDAVAKWDGSAHALSGVGCADCHAKKAETVEEMEAAWVESPTLDACKSCHRQQVKTFTEGRHGMRFHHELPKLRKAPKEGIGAFAAILFQDEPLDPITVGESPLPGLKADAADREIGTCNACHKPHEVDIRPAAVDACADCHNDTHTQNYFTSPHYALWQAEMAGGAPGTGVSCADCHMPKIKGGQNNRLGRMFTTHNQNAYLRPNEKMIRAVCLSCHSLDFAIDALADPNLVESNFNGRPAVQIESIDWALKRVK
ncbi:MAG: ammonia-forming cytochrome c nitrite reductase subunit c552 [Pseudomonadota bacterium]